MKRSSSYTHEFVEAFPDRLADGVLYVSVEFANTAHRCMCGCGQEVYARLSPRDWALTFDGETCSLKPSIGNWSFDCQSHYWLLRGKVSWAGQFSKREIEDVRRVDRTVKDQHEAWGAEIGDVQSEPSYGPVKRFLRWLVR